ncbi:MAG: hypothetical protein P1U68_05285 [Verrucomicrobiales bacterium]|nr:hypothetical protein [Verrucomicrobiales bacterium]
MSKSATKSPSGRSTPGVHASFRHLTRILFAIAFVLCIYLSGLLGVQMAKNRIPGATTAEKAQNTAASMLTLGNTGEPVYFATSPESLRHFFNTYASPGERASADLSSLDIRRINGLIEVTTRKAEADAVEVTVNSGAIAGAVYWVHHTQIPDRTMIDPIIPPVPTREPSE